MLDVGGLNGEELFNIRKCFLTMSMILSVSYLVLLLCPPIYAHMTDLVGSLPNTLHYLNIDDALSSVMVLQITTIIMAVRTVPDRSHWIQISKCLMANVLGVSGYHLLTYCFGAMFVSKETLLLSAALSAMTIIPSVNDIYGNGNGLEMDKFSGYSLWCGLAGTVMGSYLLPLDWFVPYQVFPLPNLLGLGCGHFIGSLLSAARCWAR